MNETMEMLLQKDASDSIVDRIHETRHRIAAYFGNDFMRMARLMNKTIYFKIGLWLGEIMLQLHQLHH